MSRTDKDAPYHVRSRLYGRPADPCGPTCCKGIEEVRTKAFRFAFRSDEVPAIEHLLSECEELGYSVSDRTEDYGILRHVSPYRHRLPDGLLVLVPPSHAQLADGSLWEPWVRANPIMRSGLHGRTGFWVETPRSPESRLDPDRSRHDDHAFRGEWRPELHSSQRRFARQARLWTLITVEREERRARRCTCESVFWQHRYGRGDRHYREGCRCEWCIPGFVAKDRASVREHRAEIRRALAATVQEAVAELSLEDGPSPVHASHSFLAGRCMHCGCDDHSCPGPDGLADDQRPCPVPVEERASSWSFGPSGPDAATVLSLGLEPGDPWAAGRRALHDASL